MDDFGEEGSADLEHLALAAQAGDTAARDRLVEHVLPPLRAYVRLKMSPAQRAKESGSDIVQSICLELLNKLDAFEPRGASSFRAWLFRSALNELIDNQRYWQAERRNPAVERVLDAPASSPRALADCYATISTPSQAAMRIEDVQRVEAALDRLPDHYREVIVLSRIVGLSHREVAEQLGRTETASRTLLRRALVLLAGILDDSAND